MILITRLHMVYKTTYNSEPPPCSCRNGKRVTWNRRIRGLIFQDLRTGWWLISIPQKNLWLRHYLEFPKCLWKNTPFMFQSPPDEVRPKWPSSWHKLPCPKDGSMDRTWSNTWDCANLSRSAEAAGIVWKIDDRSSVVNQVKTCCHLDRLLHHWWCGITIW